MGAGLPGAVRLFVIDDEYLLPQDRTVTIRLGLPATQARDLLSGEPVTLDAGRLTVALPGGGFRVIEFTPAG